MFSTNLKKYGKKLHKEGKQEGKLEGKKEGIELNKIETVHKMLDLKFSLNDISAVTGISIEEIKKIQIK